MKGKLSEPVPTARGVMRIVCLLSIALALGSCGGGKSSNGSAFTIGGTISGLTAGSVVLIDNGTTTVSVAAGATTWTFPGTFASGSSYSVSVLAQPTGELCEVTGGGSATALTADVADVTVVCSDYGQWTWESGGSTDNASGAYGILGVASASNVPGARYGASSWTDSAGNLWLFGGYGYGSTGALGALNDLWQYSSSTGQWSWVSGGNAGNAAGVYGTEGTAASGNVPGARYSASAWIDASGNLWLFGGYGYGSTSTIGRLNDLWRFNPGTGLWVWVNGSNSDNTAGTYGTLGTATNTNVPGARQAASAWIDSLGNLWLFGGYGYGSTGGPAALNDLWQYSPGSGAWTWVSGVDVGNAAGTYGTLGTTASTNVPGARQATSSWTDSSGNLWLFGGYGYDSTGALGYLADLWQYSPSSGAWIWIGGSNAHNAGGTYGTQGTASAGDAPGARQAASAWIDSAGNSWLFGGYGYDSSGNLGALNDLWEYSSGTGLWNWVSGSSQDNAGGVYGRQGAISPSAVPGARQEASAWTDSAGHLWLFGGVGYDSAGNGFLNDLWQYQPP
jgi:N-acetylneuraminic acid mutarotase